MNAKGTFKITLSAEPPYDVLDGVMLGRAAGDKRFSGPLDATSKVNMLSARGPVNGSAGYVAIERVTGSLDGRHGTFVLQHNGIMDRGTPTLAVTVVPDSGTGDLRGLRGRMAIEITGGQHFYVFDYELES